MNRFLTATLSIVLVSVASPGQTGLSPGDIGFVSFWTNQFYVRRTTGVVNTVFINTGSFGGTGFGYSQAILWDPDNPNSFIIGGNGFVGRATMTGPASATYSVINNTSIGEVAQMSWDGAGSIVVADFTTSQLYKVNPATGAVTVVTSGGQPWGTTLNAGVYDPAGRTYYAGNAASIYRRNAAGTTTVLASPGSYTTGLIRDPHSASVIASVGSANRLIRVNPCGGIEDLILGGVTFPTCVAADLNGDFIIGDFPSSTNVIHLYRVPNSGGSATLIATVTAASGYGVNGVAVAGLQMTLTITPVAGGDRALRIVNIPAGAVEGWTLISTTTTPCVSYGPLFGITPDTLTWQLIMLSPMATPGSPFHWVPTAPAPLFPAGPFMIPASLATALSGQSWDLCALALGAAFTPLAWNVQRYVW